jgi:hypothetical protein
MASAPQPMSWHDVSSLDEFADLLEHLSQAVEAARTPHGDQSRPPLADRSLNDYFWAWSRLLGDGLYRDGPLPQERDGNPGWRGLAFQAHTALTAAPGYNCALADSELQWQEVTSAPTLRQFLGALATDLARDQRETRERAERGLWAGDGGSWAHHDLAAFLETWAASLRAEHVGPDPFPPVEPVTWQSIAIQLSAAQVYE